jgi:cation diffusion facilitator CzcD-associated flavoprotein CzcO
VRTSVVVIGGGQAGLAMSWWLDRMSTTSCWSAA